MKEFAYLLFGAFLASLSMLSSAPLSAQGDEFVPNGKPVLRVFSNFHTTSSNGETASEFELLRVYLGYEHHFSKHLYAKANLDIGNPGVGNHEMAAYVKNAYLSYRASNLTVNFGMISTTQFKVQESAWGYRYLEKSFQDEYKFNSSADLGISAAYKVGEVLTADVIIANGEGYKRIQADSTLRTGFGLTLNPVQNLTGRVYYDFSNNVNTQSSIATFLGYANERFSLGAEYMKQFNPDFEIDKEWDGLSFFGTFFVAPKWKLFARYDKLSSNTLEGETADWNLSGDGQNFIAGFEFEPARGIKLAPNFKGWSPADAGEDFMASFYLNCEIKF